MTTPENPLSIARNALIELLQAPLPNSLIVDGHEVKVVGESAVGDQRSVTCTWSTGSVVFRLQVRADPVALEVRDEPGGQCAWSNFGSRMESAISAGKPEIVLEFENTFRFRGEGPNAGGENRRNGLRSRQIAENSGLPGTATVAIGRYQIDDRRWHDDGSLMLKRLLTLAVIKAHFFDDGKGSYLRDAPLFSRTHSGSPAGSSPGDSALQGPPGEHAEDAGKERLTGLNSPPGPAMSFAETLRGVLQRAQDDRPTSQALVAWVCDTYKAAEVRAQNLVRHLRNMELLSTYEGMLTLTDIGLAFLESGDPLIVYRALARHYTGITETLEFFAQNPDTRIAELLPHLNRAQGTDWKTETQARIRADWLVGLGLLALDRGRFKLTESGRTLLQDIGKSAVPSAPDTKDAPSEVDAPALRKTERVRLVPSMVQADDLVLPAELVDRCCAALNAGKHLLLIGPPGTAKSTLAARLAEHAATTGICNDPLLATASADWTTYDTIGGWTQRNGGELAFREGVVTRALREQRWVVLDEVNRADIDKCFGELFTVLAGGTVTTAYSQVINGREEPITIGPDAPTYLFGPWFRMIATMNVRDKASLYRLSYAFLRRFAVIAVPALEDDELRKLVDRHVSEHGFDAEFANLAHRAFSSQHGFGRFVKLGPSMLLDVIAYAVERGGNAVQGVAEGFEMLVFPQLEGLGDAQAKEADACIEPLFGTAPTVVRQLRASFRASFPHLWSNG